MASARFAWGIDVGNRALKAVRLVRDGNDQLKIDDFEVIEHEQILSQSGDNRESLVQTALANFAQRHLTKGGRVGIGVSGQASFARFIKLPPVQPNKIPEIVRFEAIQQIPFPLEDVEWSYQLFSTAESPDVEVGIFAMRKELVNQNIKNFTDVGVDVHAVQMNPLAVYSALYHDDRLKGTAMIIDLGAENTDLIIAEGEGIWMRSIPIGGNNFTEALVKAFKLKFNKAEELKRNAATSKYGRQILQAMRPVFADLVAEIQRSIGFYSSTHRDSRIARVLALGGTFRLPGLQKYLQQNLQLDVMRVDRLSLEVPPDAKFASAFNDNILSSVSAYGLALQAMGQTKITSSLLPEKIQRERMWRDKTKWFAAAAAAVVLGTGVAMGSLYWKSYEYTTQHAAYGLGSLGRTVSEADKLSNSWKTIETSGSEERKQMFELAGAINDRNITSDLSLDIMNAFVSTASADEMKKPRDQRKVVLLDGWKEQFKTDMGPFLGMPQAQFITLADLKFDAGLSTAATSNAMDMSLFGGRGGGAGRRSGGGVKKMEVVEAAGQRGLLVTIRCRTPFQYPDQLVLDTVVKALQARNETAANPPLNYAIKRVDRAEVRKIRLEDRPMKASRAMVGHIKKPNTPGGAVMPVGTTPALINPVGGSVAGAQAQGQGESQVDPWEDPLVPGESTKNDNIVTLLMAVVYDPAPVKKDANGDKVAANQ